MGFPRPRERRFVAGALDHFNPRERRSRARGNPILVRGAYASGSSNTPIDSTCEVCGNMFATPALRIT
jgi:hypothetical protein